MFYELEDPLLMEGGYKNKLGWELDSTSEEITEAEVPVPDRLLPKRRSKELVSHLRLSQKIGLLVYLNREELISPGGEERLLYLQRKASFDAISSGLKFAQRLQNEKKLISDFRPHMVELNRRPQSKRFRATEVRRIGVGYRDKGTLPELSSKARIKATQESWLYLPDLPEEVQQLLRNVVPACLDGDWLDLSELSESSEISMALQKQPLHTQL
jgi:hypothetical protein